MTSKVGLNSSVFERLRNDAMRTIIKQLMTSVSVHVCSFSNLLPRNISMTIVLCFSASIVWSYKIKTELIIFVISIGKIIVYGMNGFHGFFEMKYHPKNGGKVAYSNFTAQKKPNCTMNEYLSILFLG